ncbi:MAG: hypothetical protein HeimC3_24450 [Candidatus Heimdallarchaeota archaeon LC_3]|nr:MAG: hypothetical protein HeimC3_24450 [Candidatus Heimdallarchaeota archaeon LC_3]
MEVFRLCFLLNYFNRIISNFRAGCSKDLFYCFGQDDIWKISFDIEL